MTYTAPNSNGVNSDGERDRRDDGIGDYRRAPPTLQRIAITPAGAGVLIDTSVQMTATGIYSDGSTQNLTGAVTWGATPTSIATITAGGLVTAVLPGTATITATSGAIQGTTTVNVTVPPLPAVRPGGAGANGPAERAAGRAPGWGCRRQSEPAPTGAVALDEGAAHSRGRRSPIIHTSTVSTAFGANVRRRVISFLSDLPAQHISARLLHSIPRLPKQAPNP